VSSQYLTEKNIQISYAISSISISHKDDVTLYMIHNSQDPTIFGVEDVSEGEVMLVCPVKTRASQSLNVHARLYKDLFVEVVTREYVLGL
jgi:hypothetical protein